jgi:hypothetical protein
VPSEIQLALLLLALPGELIHLAWALFTSRSEQCSGELHEKQLLAVMCEPMV